MDAKKIKYARRISVMMFLRLIAMSLMLLGTACTTIEDFRSMQDHERAEKVCHSSKAYLARKASLNSTKKTWSEQSKIVTNGYKIVETCQEVEVPSGETTCQGRSRYNNDYGDQAISCTEKKVKQRQCTKTPVPIDVNWAEKQMRTTESKLQNMRATDTKLTSECVARVMNLSPEDAYALYKAKRDW